MLSCDPYCIKFKNKKPVFLMTCMSHPGQAGSGSGQCAVSVDVPVHCWDVGLDDYCFPFQMIL